MKKITKIFAIALCFMIVTSCAPVFAAKAPAAPGKLKVKERTYYSYWNAHRKELKKAGCAEGDGYDAIISWSKASKASGYTVAITWEYNDYSKRTSKVNVKKSAKKYIFTTNGGKNRCHKISKNEKIFITKGGGYKFAGSALSFQIDGGGSMAHIVKVTVKSYRTVKGKRIYSKPISRKFPSY